jgi:hypothetical protein
LTHENSSLSDGAVDSVSSRSFTPDDSNLEITLAPIPMHEGENRHKPVLAPTDSVL